MLSERDMKLGRMAVSRGLITAEQLGAATMAAATHADGLLGAIAQLVQRRPDSLARMLEVAPPAAAAPPPGLPAEVRAGAAGRYEIWGEIGAGGMGRIYVAYDREIHRKVAIKTLRQAENDAALVRVRRFIEEIQATGQLEHPSIVPIYDMGTFADGQPFYVMRYVKGRSLESLIEDARVGRSSAAEFGRVRSLLIFHQICMAMHFAHDKGVIHRDLKPDNIMIGSCGEVQIIDWGLAKILGKSEPSDAVAPGAIVSSGAHPVTLDGQVLGTPAYMSPEQAQGASGQVGPPTDVYALGAILYALLTGHPPHGGANPEAILRAVIRGVVVAPHERAPERNIPAALSSLCLRALAPRLSDRLPSARVLADEISAFLEGDRERERNLALAVEHHAAGVKLQEELIALRERLGAARAEETRLARTVQPWRPFAERGHVWDARKARERIEDDLATTFARATDQLARGLRALPTHAPSRALLAELYWQRFLEAEASGDRRDQAFFRNLVERYGDGAYDARLTGDGRLRVTTLPAAAEVFASRIVEDGPLLQGEREIHLEATPIDRPLPRGSYVLRLVAHGRRDVLLPIAIGRSEEITARVHLYTDEEIGAPYVYIPGGPVMLGGDPQSMSARERFRADRPDFFIGRLPVTVGEYKRFITGLAARGLVDEAVRRMPRETSNGGQAWAWRSDRLEPLVPAEDPLWDDRFPVTSVSWEDAMAYAEWLGREEGRAITLPHDQDWEKAARGADERFFPWGNHHDHTFANNAHSHAAGGKLVPAGSFPLDRSPYGVLDMAGNVRQLCRNSPGERYADAAVLKGGGFTSPAPDVRLAGRAMVQKTDVRRLVGFRVAVYPGGMPSAET